MIRLPASSKASIKFAPASSSERRSRGLARTAMLPRATSLTLPAMYSSMESISLEACDSSNCQTTSDLESWRLPPYASHTVSGLRPRCMLQTCRPGEIVSTTCVSGWVFDSLECCDRFDPPAYAGGTDPLLERHA